MSVVLGTSLMDPFALTTRIMYYRSPNLKYCMKKTDKDTVDRVHTP